VALWAASTFARLPICIASPEDEGGTGRSESATVECASAALIVPIDIDLLISIDSEKSDMDR
jgi:hypothetical protein